MPLDGSISPQMGRVVNGYRILELIAVGGNSRVYRAESATRGVVALKVVRFDEMAADYERRLRREPEIQRGAGHENIVRIDEWFRVGDEFFLVMEYVDGASLWRLIHEQRGPFTFGEARDMLLQILPALKHLHGLGIIHRDIKPGNILVATDGSVKLADFGIAKYSWQQGQTRTQLGIGTPEYMSPEQARGAEIDHRTDIYSTGITLFESVCGRTPFGLGNETPAGYMEVIRGILSDPVPDPRRWAPTLPSGAVTLIMRATAKRPEDRYQSVDEMSAALEAVPAEERAPATHVGGWNLGATASAGRDAEAADAGEASGSPAPSARSLGVGARSSLPVAPLRARPWLLAAFVLLAVLGVGLAAGVFGGREAPSSPSAPSKPILTPAQVAALLAERYETGWLRGDSLTLAGLYAPMVVEYLGRDSLARDSVQALIGREVRRIARTDSFAVAVDSVLPLDSQALQVRWTTSYRRVRNDSVRFTGSTADILELARSGDAWLVRRHERRLLAGSAPDGPAKRVASTTSRARSTPRSVAPSSSSRRATAAPPSSSRRRVDVRFGPGVRIELNDNAGGGSKGKGKAKGKGKRK